ncbi:MAG: MFS transporter [Candidatus Thorarchaeota archaeon]|nr:MFS transporter [Candidatus Thorarchaeota archaeon]
MDEAQAVSNGRLPRRVFIVGSLTQFAVGLHSPFLNSYLIDMGANYAEIGAFRAVGNVAPTVMQPAWGAASDRIGHNKAFVVTGTLMGLFTVYLFVWAHTPLDMIILYAIQSILFSIQIPTWLSLIGGLMGERERGQELGRLGMATNIASLVATLWAGFMAGIPSLLPALRLALGGLGPILLPPGNPIAESYYLPFYMTAVVGICSSLASLTIMEKRRPHTQKRTFPPVLKLLRRPGDFRRLCFVATFFSFGMSMAWPFFIVVQRTWLKNSLFEIALASAIMTISMVVLTVPFGKLSDRVGRRPLIILGRALLFLVPALYAAVLFVRDTVLVYISNVIAGIATAASMNATTAYIYDVAPEGERGTHISVYNTFTGVIFLLGSLVAGILGEALVPSLGLEIAVFAMLVLSAILRVVASLMYFRLREPRVYVSTVRRELHNLVNRKRHDADSL